MSVEIKKLKGSKVQLTFKVEASKFDEAIDKTFEKKKNTIEIPGFRKGKVSKQFYIQRFGIESLYADALDEVINSEYVKCIKENKLEVCAQPDIDVKWETVKQGSDVEFTLVVAVLPEVKLGQYLGVEVKKEKVKVSAKDVTEYIDRILRQHAALESVEGKPLELGDTAIFDFSGSVDGIPFEGGTADNYSLEIGSGQFIPGFEDQMVGMNIGDEKDLDVTFPKEYHAENLAGKTAIFKVKINEIKKKVLPELTDEFVSEELEIEDVKTVKAYKEFVKEVITKEKTEASENKFESDIIDKVMKNAKVEIPEELINEEVEQQVKRIEQQAKMYNLTVEVLLKYSGLEGLESFKENVRPGCIEQVKQRLVFDQIAKEEAYDVTDEEYEIEIANAAKDMNKSVAELKKAYPKERLVPFIQTQKAYAMVKKTAIDLNDPEVKAAKAKAKEENK